MGALSVCVGNLKRFFYFEDFENFLLSLRAEEVISVISIEKKKDLVFGFLGEKVSVRSIMFIANRLVRKHRKLVDSHVSKTFVRCLNVHEYVAMDLFQKYGVNVPKNGVASTAEEAEKIWKDAGSGDMVIKAQILAGGRGLGTFKNGFQGGVHMVTKPGQASECTYFLLFRSFIISLTLKQKQQTPKRC